ncbi:hypothetical protein ACOSQ3_022897 [Xanthoceras sorbifolium]
MEPWLCGVLLQQWPRLLLYQKCSFSSHTFILLLIINYYYMLCSFFIEILPLNFHFCSKTSLFFLCSLFPVLFINPDEILCFLHFNQTLYASTPDNDAILMLLLLFVCPSLCCLKFPRDSLWLDLVNKDGTSCF